MGITTITRTVASLALTHSLNACFEQGNELPPSQRPEKMSLTVAVEGNAVWKRVEIFQEMKELLLLLNKW